MSLLATAAFAGTDKPTAGSDQDTSVACVIEDWQPTADEVAEMNAETEALIAYLADAGFTVEVETDDFGISYPIFGGADETNDPLWEAMDAFYAERYGDIDLGGFEDWQPSADEIAEINAETDALIASLADAGFALEVETDEFGITYPVFRDADESNDALWEAVDAFYTERYGDVDFGEFDSGESDIEVWEPSAGEIAEMNAETDALIASLADAGFTLEVETDEFGITYPVFRDADESNDALWEAMDAFYLERYGELDEWQPTAEELAAINAETDALIAYLADAGITVATATDEVGFVYPDFTDADYNNAALMQIIDEYYMALYPVDLCFEAWLDSPDVDTVETDFPDVDAGAPSVTVG